MYENTSLNQGRATLIILFFLVASAAVVGLMASGGSSPLGAASASMCAGMAVVFGFLPAIGLAHLITRK